ncbi:sugar phosphate isomerase/epimerase [Lacihabitans sp. LS3-19]|uniref:sugar phosphate isomerase/epimerase family protein n=1 Tax=Lacihabitans sp. LS3-19 TaxID=2487335 RepID=UPI0020CBBF7D|nr:sugar phosphate isomerase/epimerase [Lacihabitans sp. LS3-19]MCP9767723.1 sugar phosphate isomerase/epimerase [Lacihabitans sp. LS3-19]
MKQSRRNFIMKYGLAAVSTPLLIQSLGSCTSASKEKSTNDAIATKETIDQFGLQLWTVKEDMAKDPKATLKAVADAGYKQLESFTGEKGIFWGMTPAEFKTYTRDLGMQMISSHINPDFTTKKETEDEFKKLVDDCASIGVSYVLNPFPGEIKTSDEWKKITEGLNRQGEITKAAGIKMGYHNHHIEFSPTSDGSLPEEIMLKGTDPELVAFELDLYWIVKAGQDPEKWLKEYANRFKLVHVKDLYKEERVKEIETTEKPEDAFWPLGASTTLGNGRIDFSKILKIAKENGVEKFIIEQERFDNSTPLQDIKIDADYLKSLVLV